MGDDSGSRAADILRHANAGIWHLSRAGFTTQLLDNFYNLINSGCADRMSACF
jgi:hypothetical protein